MSKYCIVFCTAPDEKSAEKIAETLVEKKLAACCSIIPSVKSIYSWQGKIQKDQEFLLFIKSTEENYKRIEHAILELHPYEIPEIISVDILQGSTRYLNWINDTVESDNGNRPQKNTSG